jgi:hypothetical protein
VVFHRELSSQLQELTKTEGSLRLGGAISGGGGPCTLGRRWMSFWKVGVEGNVA